MPIRAAAVRAFWNQYPDASADIEAPLATPEYFAAFDRLREADDAEPYDFSNRIHGYDQAAGKRVLDIGCANGYVLWHYARHGAYVHGADITETALNLSRRRFELGGRRAEFRLTDGKSLPYPDRHFDIVCSMGVLHHMEDPRPMLAEARRVLRPGGRLILMLHHRNSWKYRVVLPLRLLLDARYRGKTLQQALNMNDGDDCPLAKVYSRGQVSALLADFRGLRFTVNQLSWRELLLIPALARRLQPWLPPLADSRIASALGWNLYVEAMKPA